MQTIALINASTAATDAELAAARDALQTQVDRDFGPEWGTFATLSVFAHADAVAGQIPPDAWWITLLDNSDVPNALGYHDLTPKGLPAGKCFVETEKAYGGDWRVCLSHELLEMLADPDVNLAVFASPTRLVSREVCDAPEADAYGYDIGNVRVSNFVTRAWFESFREKGETAFDFQKQILAPFSLLPGGYMSMLDLTTSSEGWRQITNEIGLSHAGLRRVRPHAGSRREKRALAADAWLRSTVGVKDAEILERKGKKIWI